MNTVVGIGMSDVYSPRTGSVDSAVAVFGMKYKDALLPHMAILH